MHKLALCAYACLLWFTEPSLCCSVGAQRLFRALEEGPPLLLGIRLLLLLSLWLPDYEACDAGLQHACCLLLSAVCTFVALCI